MKEGLFCSFIDSLFVDQIWLVEKHLVLAPVWRGYISSSLLNIYSNKKNNKEGGMPHRKVNVGSSDWHKSSCRFLLYGGFLSE